MELKLSDVDLQALAEQIAPLITTTQPEPDWANWRMFGLTYSPARQRAGLDYISLTSFQKSRSRTINPVLGSSGRMVLAR